MSSSQKPADEQTWRPIDDEYGQWISHYSPDGTSLTCRLCSESKSHKTKGVLRIRRPFDPHAFVLHCKTCQLHKDAVAGIEREGRNKNSDKTNERSKKRQRSSTTTASAATTTKTAPPTLGDNAAQQLAVHDNENDRISRLLRRLDRERDCLKDAEECVARFRQAIQETETELSEERRAESRRKAVHRIGSRVLVRNHPRVVFPLSSSSSTTAKLKLVNEFGHLPGEGKTGGPYKYVLATVERVNFEVDGSRSYMLSRGDADLHERVGAEYIEPVKNARDVKATLRAPSGKGADSSVNSRAEIRAEDDGVVENDPSDPETWRGDKEELPLFAKTFEFDPIATFEDFVAEYTTGISGKVAVRDLEKHFGPSKRKSNTLFSWRTSRVRVNKGGRHSRRTDTEFNRRLKIYKLIDEGKTAEDLKRIVDKDASASRMENERDKIVWLMGYLKSKREGAEERSQVATKRWKERKRKGR